MPCLREYHQRNTGFAVHVVPFGRKGSELDSTTAGLTGDSQLEMGAEECIELAIVNLESCMAVWHIKSVQTATDSLLSSAP